VAVRGPSTAPTEPFFLAHYDIAARSVRLRRVRRCRTPFPPLGERGWISSADRGAGGPITALRGRAPPSVRAAEFALAHRHPASQSGSEPCWAFRSRVSPPVPGGGPSTRLRASVRSRRAVRDPARGPDDFEGTRRTVTEYVQRAVPDADFVGFRQCLLRSGFLALSTCSRRPTSPKAPFGKRCVASCLNDRRYCPRLTPSRRGRRRPPPPRPPHHQAGPLEQVLPAGKRPSS